MKIRYLSHDYASKSYSTIIEQNFYNCINRTNTVHTRVRVTCYIFFGKHHLPLPVNLIYYHLLNYPYYTISYHIIYHTRCNDIQYNYIDITILLSYCNYIVTILISTIYSYIYRYNLSIKIYDNQYRYKYTDSIIRMILNNTEMNNYTVYSLHNIQ